MSLHIAKYDAHISLAGEIYNIVISTNAVPLIHQCLAATILIELLHIIKMFQSY